MTALREGVNPNIDALHVGSPIEFDDPPCGAPIDVKTYGGTSGGNMNLRPARR